MAVDDQSVLARHVQTDEKRCWLVRHNIHCNALRDIGMWCPDLRACGLCFATSKREANIRRLDRRFLLSVCHGSSAVKNSVSLQTLDRESNRVLDILQV